MINLLNYTALLIVYLWIIGLVFYLVKLIFIIINNNKRLDLEPWGRAAINKPHAGNVKAIVTAPTVVIK